MQFYVEFKAASDEKVIPVAVPVSFFNGQSM